MPGTVPKLIEGQGLVAIQLGADGRNLVAGTGQVLRGRGFTSVATSVSRDDGTDQTVRNAAGDICAYRPAKPRVTGIDLTINFCGVPIDGLTFLLGAIPLLDVATDPIGFALPNQDSGIAVPPVDMRIIQDQDDGKLANGMHIFPKVTNMALASISDVDETFVTFSITGTALRNSKWRTDDTGATERSPQWAADPLTAAHDTIIRDDAGPYAFIQTTAADTLIFDVDTYNGDLTTGDVVQTPI